MRTRFAAPLLISLFSAALLPLNSAATAGLSITTNILSAATPGSLYTTSLSATGGSGSYTWSGSGMPAWLTLSPAGTLSGTPPTEVAAVFLATVTDGANTVSKPITLPANNTPHTHQFRIETIAGQKRPDNVAATSTFLSAPEGLAIDGSGNIYVAEVDAGIIRKIAPGGTSVTTVAGNGTRIATLSGAPATATGFLAPRYVAVDTSGNVFIADQGNCTVDRVDVATQILTIYAGTPGVCGYSGDNGAATSAQLSSFFRQVAVDASGNVFLADSGNQIVRRIDASSHVITTYAGMHGTSAFSGNGGLATAAGIGGAVSLAFDSGGNLYIASLNRIRRVDHTTLIISAYAGTGSGTFNGDGLIATSTNMGNPRGMAFDASNNLYFTDDTLLRTRRIDANTKIVTTIAGNGTSSYSGDGGPATSAGFANDEGVVVDATGNVYIADFTDSLIRQVTPGSPGTVTVFAGSFGPDNTAPTSAFMVLPAGAVVDPAGNVYIGDGVFNRIRKINPSITNIQTIAGSGYSGYSGDGGPAISALLNDPYPLSIDSSGNLYFGQSGAIREIDTTGKISTVAGGGSNLTLTAGASATSVGFNAYGIAVNSTGTLYFSDGNANIWSVVGGKLVSVAGTGTAGTSPDGTLATAAQLNGPGALRFDAANNLYFVDGGNNLIRKILASDDTVHTVAGNGTAGYLGDGGSATQAELSPSDLAVAPNGDIYILDNYDVIRLVTAATGLIETIAGDGAPGFSGDGGPALAAQFNIPGGPSLDSSGRLMLADTRSGVIRRLTQQFTLAVSVSPPGAGTVSGAGLYDSGAMASPGVTANAGYNFTGFSGDATGTANPLSITMNASKNLVANFTALVSTPPTTVSVTPSSGSATSGSFVFTYSSPNGATYLSRVDALFNGSLNGAAGCWVYYKPSTNGLYLFSNTVASIYGPLTPGTAGTLTNDQCTINGVGSSVSLSGNTLTLTLSINFTSYFRGVQTIYGDATDAAGMTSNWQTLGSWTSGTLVSTPPTATSVTPASGGGGGGSFTFNYSDLNGYSYMGRVDALFNSGLSATNGCYVIYWPATNVIFLQNDSATVWSAALTPGQAGTISNSQCSINGPASSVSGSGSTLSLTLAVSFTPGFAGTQTMFGIGYDKAGVNGGWQTLGTWNASGVVNSPPTADSVSPSSGSATSGAFAFKYSSANGPGYLSRVDALFNGSLNGAAGCWIYYLPGTNGIYLYSNTVNAVYGPLTPGASGTIQNDQCTINGTGTTATGSGNTLTLNLNMTFNNYFRGQQTMYAYATDDQGGVSGWQTVGTWTTGTLVSTPPTAISVTPSSGTGTSGSFTFNYSSVNGYSYMNRVDALFNGSLSGSNGCYVIYWPATNVLFLVNDAGTTWSAALTPGQAESVSNSQCTISGPASSVSGSGSTLSLTLGMSFSGSFTGSQTAFGIGYDKSGVNGGWTNLGYWTP